MNIYRIDGRATFLVHAESESSLPPREQWDVDDVDIENIDMIFENV